MLATLALGIGATTAVFSVIYGALLHPCLYRAANRIVRLVVETKNGQHPWMDLNGPQAIHLRQSPVVENLIAGSESDLSLTGEDPPEDVFTVDLTPNGFNIFGTPVTLGRGLLPSDAPEGKVTRDEKRLRPAYRVVLNSRTISVPAGGIFQCCRGTIHARTAPQLYLQKR